LLLILQFFFVNQNISYFNARFTFSKVIGKSLTRAPAAFANRCAEVILSLDAPV